MAARVFDIPNVIEITGTTDRFGGVVHESEKYRKITNIKAFEIYLKEFYCEHVKLTNVEADKVYFILNNQKIHLPECRIVRVEHLIAKLSDLHHQHGLNAQVEYEMSNLASSLHEFQYVKIIVKKACTLIWSERLARALGFLEKDTEELSAFAVRCVLLGFVTTGRDYTASFSYDKGRHELKMEVTFVDPANPHVMHSYLPTGRSKNIWFDVGTDPFQTVLIECSVVVPEFFGTQLVHTIASVPYDHDDSKRSHLIFIPENVQMHNLEKAELSPLVLYLKTITGRKFEGVKCLFKLALVRKALM